jgi:putative addiction module component (TIGR02574 family)
MNKIEDAWAVLKTLSPREQELAAEAILDYVAGANGLELSAQQAAEVERRLRDHAAKTVTPVELRSRLRKITP